MTLILRYHSSVKYFYGPIECDISANKSPPNSPEPIGFEMNKSRLRGFLSPQRHMSDKYRILEHDQKWVIDDA